MDTFDNDSNQNITDEPAKRFNVELEFEFRRNYARKSDMALVKNLSVSGALVKTDRPLKLSEKINVFLTVSGRKRRIPATVVWVGDRGVGLKFEHFNNRDLQIVDDILYYATEKSSSDKSLLDTILNKVA
jgi:Tfp pilus assembly protein PilZ